MFVILPRSRHVFQEDSAQAPLPAEAPAVVGALLKGAPVAAPIKNTHHAAHAPAASEGIIVIGENSLFLLLTPLTYSKDC